MTKTWFIADTHFGHANVIKYDNRPFADIDEMESELIKRWNKKVATGDTVWFLGDFAFFAKQDYISGLLKRLKGVKYMVMGNHDTKSPQFYRDCGFKEVYNHPVILKNHFILSHNPINLGSDNNFFNIYGHVHTHPAYADTTPNSCCVCCNRWDYTPIRIEKFEKYEMSEFTMVNVYDMVSRGKWFVVTNNNYSTQILGISISPNFMSLNCEITDYFLSPEDIFSKISDTKIEVDSSMYTGESKKFYLVKSTS